MEISESQLIQQIRDGKDAGFEELMRRYKKPVLNFIYRLIGDAGDAEDVAQEVFVRVYQNIERYRPETKFSTWLFAIARYAALDHLRYRHRHPTESLESAPEPTKESNDVQLREVESAISAAIQQLPEDQRTTIILSEYHDQSHAEIASIMGCSEKSVESRIYRAKQFLRAKLKYLLE